ncbi:hypothetical protein Bca52824_073518 [Brassica carinata]|uniref:Uncharacterized protein n=1 Tax=Brassica carinata TaxID=52824 RepID=A0A8X7QFI3_BRACI|nr:hypothetical protein Bca52824_073518 [Brassica carinata]
MVHVLCRMNLEVVLGHWPDSHMDRPDQMGRLDRTVGTTNGYELRRVMNGQEARVMKGYKFSKDGRTVRLIGVLCRKVRSVARQSGWAWALLGCMDPGLGPDQELRLIVVKPKSHEDSISEGQCGKWVDCVRNELIIAYRTHCNLCIESHLG